MACFNKDLDEVSRNKIIEESIRREERVMKLTTEFKLTDPRKMSLLPDKPTAVHPQHMASPEQLAAAEALLTSLSCVQHITQTPSQIYALPLTANMEYGFFNSAMAPNDPMFTHYKGHCDVTKYASSYASMTGHSPHMRPGAGKKAA